MPTNISELDFLAHQLDLRLRLSGGLAQAVSEFHRKVVGAIVAPVDVSLEEFPGMFLYRVPKLGPGGACSIQHELDERPFDLRQALGIERLTASEPEVRRVVMLNRVVGLLHDMTRADWSGIYELRTIEGEPALVKEAYRGRPSRAVFPCNSEFARTSNNVTAVLTHRAVLVSDVDAHVASGKPYYECDAEVKSELCMPVLRNREPVGLIDLESFRANHFDFVNIALAITAANVLAEYELL